MKLSKSQFVAGVQCLKRLYWHVNEPISATPASAADEANIKQGREIGLLARRLFPGGTAVDGSLGLEHSIRTTHELVSNPTVSTIFEGTFEHDGVIVRADILHRRGDGRWRLIEVKSSTNIKEHHLEDVAIQSWVITGSGLDLASAFFAHINRAYVYRGDTIDPWRFFRIRNVRRFVEKIRPQIPLRLQAELEILALPNAPGIEPGRHCKEPVICEFFDRCNTPRPWDHISYLPRLHAKAAEELAEMGIESIRGIPDDYPLNERLRRSCTSVQTGEPWYGLELGKELETLKYPLYFMDFETVNPAIPRFAGMRPYDHIPFQWSVHIQREPDAEPEHYEFLATNGSDPRQEFIASLCAVLGEDGNIVAYNVGFESQRLSELAAWLPEFAERIKNIRGRIWDLLPQVRNNIYHPAFAGSYSLKSVLPALVPEMTYADMTVANGLDAGLAWESLVRGGLTCDEHNRIKKALLTYCGQDTLAMVRLLENLRREAKKRHEN